MANSVAIRLATDGSAQVRADFAAIGDAGDASAKRLVAAYDKASDDIQAALDRQARAAAKIQAVLPTQTQSVVNANAGTNAYGGYRDAGGGSSGQNANAAQFSALLAQQERQLEAVRSQIDPLYTAHKRYDGEIATANGLLKQGVLSEAEHAKAIAASEKSLLAAKNALDGHSGALGLNRQQTIIAQSAVLRFTDAVIAGRNPLTAFALEAHKGVEVLSSDDAGMAGGLAKVSGLINPVSIGIAALAAVVAIGTAAFVSYEDALAKLESLAGVAGAAIGITGKQLEDNAEAATAGGVLTVAAARKIESSYVELGGIGSGVLVGLTKLTADFAAGTGSSIDQAEQVLGKAFQDPVKGAEELANRYGLLSQSQIEQIRNLADQNDLYGAQAQLLADLGPAFDGAAKHAEGLSAAFDGIKASISDAWAKLGGFLTGINSATPAAQRLQDLLAKRAELGNSFAPGLRADLDRQISEAQAEITRAQATADAASSKRAEDARTAGTGYTGFQGRQQLEEARNRIQRALADPKSVAQFAATGELTEQRQALEAYTRALNTFLGPADKKRLIDQDEARLAQARTPAARQAAGHQLALDQLRGQVVTNADADADANAKGEQARARLDKAADKHAATLGREADAMRANAAAALAAGDAFLTSAAAGEDAEARQKAVTDATKNGTSATEQYARQQALNVANAIRDGDKQTAQLRDETGARERVLGAVSAGTLSVAGMNNALSDEAKLRPLIVAQAQAQGVAVDAATRAVKAHTDALKQDRATQEAIAAVQAKAANENSIQGLKDQADFAGDRTGRGQIEIARRAAQREAAGRYPDLAANDPRRQGVVDSAVDLANQQQSTDRSKLIATTTSQQRDQNELTIAQIGLVGKSADQQQVVIDRLMKEHELRASNTNISDAAIRSILEGVSAEDALKDKLSDVTDAWKELRQEGDRFIDDLFNPNGSGLKNLLKDVEQELEKLALINPLKNLLLGEGNPTLSSIGGLFGKLGSLFGGGNGFDAAPAATDFASITHFASGTNYAPGGVAWVGENGPELVNLPRGSGVTNAADTRRLMTAGGGQPQVIVRVQANDYFDAKVASISGGQIQQSAPQIAAGGAQLSADRADRARRRSLAG